jgi:hypothetical protein
LNKNPSPVFRSLARHRYLPPALLALVAALALALPGAAAAAPAPDEFTPVAFRVLHAPEPVPGADGRVHLAYELETINRAVIQSGWKPGTATLKRIQVLGDGKVLATIAGKKLAELAFAFGAQGPSTTLAPGQAGFVEIDVALPPAAPLPKRLTHRVTISLKPDHGFEATRYEAAPTVVGQREAVVVAPPLRGPGWVVGNGCCAAPTSHRVGLLPVGGGLVVGERFAIDFTQIQPDGRLVTGPPEDLASYPYFGDPVYSVAAGTVVSIVDGLPETPPGDLPPTSAARAGGNQVVVRLAPGRFAFYGHLQPGSVTVRPGQRVRTGQVLGLLGSSGNSNAPHLHFQLMDGPTALGSEGIPYRFDRFAVQGTLTNFGALFEDGTAKIAPRFRGPHGDELPLNQQVIDFP